MLRSKAFSILALAITTASLAACSIPSAQDREGTTSDAGTFFIEKSEVSLTDQTQHKELSLALNKSFTFKVCLKDTGHSKEISNHKFEITGGTENQDVISDNMGCIRWLEKISYNHLAPAKWVEVIRNIKASGIHQGQRPAKFALNPWEDQAVSLQDKKISQLVKFDQAASALQASADQGLWLDEVRLTVSEKVPGSVLGIEMRGQASFSVIKADGKNVLEPISRGNFLAEFTLINTVLKDKTEIRTVLGQTKAVPAHVVGGALILPQEVQMNLQSLCTYGQMLMAIRLEPQMNDLKLAPFEGIYTNIGECDQFKGNFFARLKVPLTTQTEGAKDISTFLGLKSSDNSDSASVAMSNSGGAPIAGNSSGSSSTIKPTKGGASKVIVKDPLTLTNIGYRGSNSFQREKIFSVTACFQAPIDSKVLRGQTFTVTKVNGQTKTMESLHSGCITWDDSMAFDYLDQECWIQKSFRIQNELLKMDETLQLDINPWDESFSSVRDSRVKDKETLQCAQNTAPQIVLNFFDFDTREISYPIDGYLGIKVQKQGILKLAARLTRPSPKSPIGIEETFLPPGKYKLRWAIVDGQVKDRDLLTKSSGYIYQAEEKEVQVEAGGLIADTLSFESANLRSIGNLNHIFFEIEPAQSKSKMTLETYQGSILLADRKETGSLAPMGNRKESLVPKLIALFKEDQKKYEKMQSDLSGKAALAENGNLRLLNLSQVTPYSLLRRAVEKQPTLPALSIADLAQWLETGKATTAVTDHLCFYWFYEHLASEIPSASDAKQSFQQCSSAQRKTANSYLNVEFRYFLQKVSKLEDLPMEVEDKVVGNSFVLSYGKDYTQTKSADINAGLNSKLLEKATKLKWFKTLEKYSEWLSPFSVGGGGRFQWAWAAKDGASNTMAVQSATALIMEKLKFKMRAEEFEKCAVIQLRPDAMPAWIHNKIKAAGDKGSALEEKLHQGLLLCQGEIQKRAIVFQESYTVINQKIYSTQVVNPHTELSRPLFIVVRGEKDHRSLLKRISERSKLPTNAEAGHNSETSLHSLILPAFSHSPTMTYPGQFISDR